MRLPLQINSAGISAQEQTVRSIVRGFDTPIFLITYHPVQNCKMIYCSVINLDRKGDSFFVSRSMRIPCVMGLNEADNRVKNVADKVYDEKIFFSFLIFTLVI